LCPSCGAETVSIDHAVPDEREEFSGQVLDDRYRVTRFIGRGGMGSVYKAFDRFKAELVAIKFLVTLLNPA